MKRFVLVLALVVAGVAAGASQAAAPVQLKKIDLSSSFTFPAGDFCTFDVTLAISGTANVTLWMNDSGLVVREHDAFTGAKVTWSANGKSFSYPGGGPGTALSDWTDYGSGAVLDGSATATLTGLFDHVPGIAPDAGKEVVDGTIVGFLPVDGVQVPLTASGTVQVQHGSQPS